MILRKRDSRDPDKVFDTVRQKVNSGEVNQTDGLEPELP